MKKYIAVVMSIALLSIWSCGQDTPLSNADKTAVNQTMSKEAPDAFDIYWESEATLWETMDFEPGRCEDPITFAQLCMGDPDVFMEIPKTIVVIGRRMCSPLDGDFINPNPDGVRMRLRARIDPYGNGHGDGLIEFKAAIGDLRGMFRGTFNSEFNNHMNSGTFEGVGLTGDFIDRVVHGQFVETESGFRFRGIISYNYPGD